MTWVLAALLLLWFGWGPLVLVVAAALLGVPRVRWWVQDHWSLPRRGARLVAVAALVLAGVVVVLPDGWLPVPPAPGVLATPAYVGRPADPAPVLAAAVPQHPWLAAQGRDPAHDATGGHTSPGGGPLGHQPEVETAWFGLEHCPRPAFDSRERMVVACGGPSGPALHVVDPETMRKLASRDLPEHAEDEQERCAATPSYLDERDRVVLGTADRHVLALRTADGRGDPELSVDQEWDLRPYVPHGDCLVALLPDWSGRLWWASLGGLVGTIAPDSGDVRVHDLGEDVAGDLVADESAGMYVASATAVHRLSAAADGTPQPAWRAAYGVGPGPGDPGSGTTPALLEGGVLAVAGGSEEGSHVVFLRRDTGAEVCRQPVFEEEDGSAAGGALVALGTGVVVTNHHGYAGVRDTLLGRTTSAGLARVDLADGSCRVRWTSPQVAPSATATASLANGLVHTYTQRRSWTGVTAWYLTALDAATGRAMWSVRAGTGVLMNNHHGAVTLGPDGSLWTGTLAGLVRVRDRD